jgi:hypothetical protein
LIILSTVHIGVSVLRKINKSKNGAAGLMFETILINNQFIRLIRNAHLFIKYVS